LSSGNQKWRIQVKGQRLKAKGSGKMEDGKKIKEKANRRISNNEYRMSKEGILSILKKTEQIYSAEMAMTAGSETIL
jgi:hypothetical protein